jgi:hypothetical protein
MYIWPQLKLNQKMSRVEWWTERKKKLVLFLIRYHSYIVYLFILKIGIMIILWSFPGWARLVQTVKSVNDSADNMVKISETADKTLTYVTKVTGVSTGAAGAAKGSVDMLKALACQDGVCAVVSGN